jgi:hypothetical protein
MRRRTTGTGLLASSMELDCAMATVDEIAHSDSAAVLEICPALIYLFATNNCIMCIVDCGCDMKHETDF